MAEQLNVSIGADFGSLCMTKEWHCCRCLITAVLSGKVWEPLSFSCSWHRAQPVSMNTKFFLNNWWLLVFILLLILCLKCSEIDLCLLCVLLWRDQLGRDLLKCRVSWISTAFWYMHTCDARSRVAFFRNAFSIRCSHGTVATQYYRMYSQLEDT